MALEFSVLEPCWVTSMGCWRVSASQVATVTARLYRMTSSTTGVQVGSDWTVPITAAGWNNGGPATPIPVTPGNTYRLVGLFPDFASKVLNYFTTGPGASGLGNGLLVIPNRANALNNGQNAFVAGAAIQLPTTANADGPSYGIDITVTDVDPATTPGTDTPIYGTDLSSAYGAVDLAAMKSNGMSYVLARVGQGAGSNGNGQLIDSLWTANAAAARANRLPLAAYWYLGDSETPASQATRCRTAIGDPGTALCLDWEAGGGDFTNLTNCLAAFRAAGLNVKMIYSRYTYYLANGGRDLVPLKCALWNSRYPTNNAGTVSGLYAAVSADRATYWQTMGGIQTKVLQYSNNVTIGAYSAADADAFNGTTAELEALFAPASGQAFLPFFPDRVKVS